MKKQNSLIAKKNGNGHISSYTLNVSLKEAQQLGLINDCHVNHFVVKEIIDNKLVVSKAFPQNEQDLIQILEDFHIVGKRMSDKLLLELLYFIEGNSEAYINQKNKVYATLRYLGKGWVGYKGKYAYFDFKLKINSRHIIESYSSAGTSFLVFD